MRSTRPSTEDRRDRTLAPSRVLAHRGCDGDAFCGYEGDGVDGDHGLLMVLRRKGKGAWERRHGRVRVCRRGGRRRKWGECSVREVRAAFCSCRV